MENADYDAGEPSVEPVVDIFDKDGNVRDGYILFKYEGVTVCMMDYRSLEWLQEVEDAVIDFWASDAPRPYIRLWHVRQLFTGRS